MSQTIYIRSRPAAFSVVVKPHAPGFNRLLIASHQAARDYADELHERSGWPVVDESDPQAEIMFRGAAEPQ